MLCAWCRCPPTPRILSSQLEIPRRLPSHASLPLWFMYSQCKIFPWGVGRRFCVCFTKKGEAVCCGKRMLTVCTEKKVLPDLLIHWWHSWIITWNSRTDPCPPLFYWVFLSWCLTVLLPLTLFIQLNLILPPLHFSLVFCFKLISQERKCFVWYLSVKRSVAGLPSLITHCRVRPRYMKQTQEEGIFFF